jgi:hypothetical protein
MKIKNNIILKNGGNLFSGTGSCIVKRSFVDVRDHLKHPDTMKPLSAQ